MEIYQVCTAVLAFLALVPLCLAQAGAEKTEAKPQPGKTQTATSTHGATSKFVGTWKLVSIDARRPNGEAAPDRYGPNTIGFIMYDATGRMAVQIMRPARPSFASGQVDQATPEEIKAAFDGYGAYFGTYEVHETEGFVIHHVEGSLFPNNVGTDQKRFFELSGDQLILKPPPQQVAGEQQIVRITWQRVK
ncbi:MAG: lipocalin-like domain-containing protein [Deltaproteobacteria bacterium]|nr:lipocalin-like domain-containing protein [Deltaproteobacteria bacterium]